MRFYLQQKTKLIHQITWEDAHILLYDIDSLRDWAEKWFIKFNLNKCYVLTQFENVMYTHRYNMYGNEFEHVFEERTWV